MFWNSGAEKSWSLMSSLHFEGTQIKEGYKSMAYSVVFRDHDKTLEEAEITAAMKKILNGLTDLGIELRS